MSRKFILTILIFALFFTVSAVLADNDGYNSWCNEDQYGCWVTDEDGGKCYIMFWSEEARVYFMGGHSEPGQLVVRKPNTPNGRLELESSGKGMGWRDYLINMLRSHSAYLTKLLGGYSLDSFIKDQLFFFENRLANGDETEESIMSGLKSWDKQLTDGESE